MTKVYKYIQLNDCKKIDRFKNILTTNQVWLSKYNTLNDPMEGIYYTFSKSESARTLLSEKNKYLIGCFGSKPDNFTLWAYYADGFRGACIEIELNDDALSKKIDYVTLEEFKVSLSADIENLETILTRKLSHWVSEAEIRVLVKDEDAIDVPGKSIQIGKITAVYFGLNVSQKNINSMRDLGVSGRLSPTINWAIVSPENTNKPSSGSFDEIIAKLQTYQDSRAKLI